MEVSIVFFTILQRNEEIDYKVQGFVNACLMICNNCGVIIYVFVMISCDIYLYEVIQLPAHCKAFEIFIRTHEACNPIMYQESSSHKRFLFTFTDFIYSHSIITKHFVGTDPIFS